MIDRLFKVLANAGASLLEKSYIFSDGYTTVTVIVKNDRIVDWYPRESALSDEIEMLTSIDPKRNRNRLLEGGKMNGLVINLNDGSICDTNVVYLSDTVLNLLKDWGSDTLLEAAKLFGVPIEMPENADKH